MADPFNSEQTARGYEPPFNTQFSVFLDNRVGKLLELVDVFDGHSIRLVGLSVIDSADHAVVRLITNDGEQARGLLRSHHMPYSESDILVVKLPGTGRSVPLSAHRGTEHSLRVFSDGALRERCRDRVPDR